MPVDWSDYPDDWKDIAKKAKDDAGWVCDRCGCEHRGDGTNGTILTVHHPDHDTSNRDAKLEVLCARCHLAAHYIENRYGGLGGQLELFDD